MSFSFPQGFEPRTTDISARLVTFRNLVDNVGKFANLRAYEPTHKTSLPHQNKTIGRHHPQRNFHPTRSQDNVGPVTQKDFNKDKTMLKPSQSVNLIKALQTTESSESFHQTGIESTKLNETSELLSYVGTVGTEESSLLNPHIATTTEINKNVSYSLGLNKGTTLETAAKSNFDEYVNNTVNGFFSEINQTLGQNVKSQYISEYHTNGSSLMDDNLGSNGREESHYPLQPDEAHHVQPIDQQNFSLSAAQGTSTLHSIISNKDTVIFEGSPNGKDHYRFARAPGNEIHSPKSFFCESGMFYRKQCEIIYM